MTQPNSTNNVLQTISRRDFVKTIGATGAALAFPGILTSSQSEAAGEVLPDRPNLLLILTDQQRYPRNWPEGWVEKNMPNWNRLAKNGVTFSRAYCNTAMCSPSRATLFTGLYPEHHKVKDTITESTSFTYNYLPVEMQNMGRMLASAGYYVGYFGKWHLSKGQTTFDPSAEDLANYGFLGWTPPDAGQDTAPENYGSRHDNRFLQSAIDFLKTQTPETTGKQPFAIIVSLVNPHDVVAYPGDYETDYPDVKGMDLGITVPDTVNEDLSTKPKVQAAVLKSSALFLGALATPQQKKNYVNFYAYLHTVIDLQLEQMFATMEKQNLVNNTVVLRMADHGEMGLSHGGLRQKAYLAYEEALNVPLIISNPLLFPNPVKTAALASLIDIMPTIATLAKVPNREKWVFRGKDLTPVFTNPSTDVQDTVLFTFDDQRAGNEVASDPMPQPNHIQCIIEKNWKYARYWDPENPANVEFEMYDLVSDPAEIKNLAGNSAYATKEAALLAKLEQVVKERLAPIEETDVKGWQEIG